MKVLFSFLPILCAVMCDPIASHNYIEEDLLNLCPGDRSKKVVSLATKTAAVFTLKVDAGLSGDFLCHLELEAPSSSYGFHIYFAEMNFLGDESLGSCPDYVQFARDQIFLTTYQSPLYCGRRLLVNASDPASVNRNFRTHETRFYVEEKDSEMDLWVKLDGSQQSPRNLTLVVTLFKKNCGAKDLNFKRCEGTNHCIRNELFCDSRINCAWPNGDVPMDEQGCSHSAAEGGSSFSPANIPIVIIVAVVVVGIITVFLIAMRTFYRSAKRPPASSSSHRHHSRPRSCQRETLEVTPPLLLSHGDGRGISSPPSAPQPTAAVETVNMDFPAEPPTYEEAVNINTHFPSSPPPYSAR